MKKLLTVSLLAIMSVSAANAKIASTEYMAKVAGATLADDGTIADLQTTSKNLVPAINELKTAMGSVASNDTVSGINTRLTTAEGNITNLQTNKLDKSVYDAALGTNGSVTQKITNLETNSATKTELETAQQELQDAIDTAVSGADGNGGLTAAIADAKKAGTDAAAAVTTLTNGQVATNKSNIEALQTGKLDASVYNAALLDEGAIGKKLDKSTYNADMADTGTYGSKIKASDDALTGLATNTGVIATYVNSQITEEMKTTSNGLTKEIDVAKSLAAGAQEAAEDAQAAADAAQATADKKVDQTTYDAALGQNGSVTQKITNLETNSATKTELQTAINTAVSGADGKSGLTADIAAAQKAADDAAAAVTTLETGKVAQNTTNITNLTNTVNDQTNGLATKATKAELGINGTLSVPTECQGAGKECALVIINGVAEWQVVQK